MQAARFFTVDPAKKGGESKIGLRLSPVGSLLKVVSYILIDFLIAILLPCLFGSSLLK